MEMVEGRQLLRIFKTDYCCIKKWVAEQREKKTGSRKKFPLRSVLKVGHRSRPRIGKGRKIGRLLAGTKMVGRYLRREQGNDDEGSPVPY